MDGKRILVIAGSDSSGGAGLEADQKVIAAHGCYAMTATTALTAQNTQGVIDVHVIPTSFVEKQIDACIDDIGVDVIKTGMLATAETVSMVGAAFRRHNVRLSVVDPVMIATSGAQLLPENAIKTMRDELLPYTTILTPNIPEAQLLLKDAGKEFGVIRNVDDLKRLAEAMLDLGPQYVLLKGGHLPLASGKAVSIDEAEDNDVVLDILCGRDSMELFQNAYIKSRNTHGTGCSLASAIAANLACGMSVVNAVKAATRYVEAGIRSATNLGKGSGPINHFHSTYKLPFAPGRFIEYILAREDVVGPWREHVQHDFVVKLADGTLPLMSFKYYLIQDYLYLIQFARANALAAYKAKTMDDIKTSAAIVSHILTETNLHLEYCEEFGLSKEDVESYEEHQGMGYNVKNVCAWSANAGAIACTAYTRYVLDIGQSEDWFALQIAFAPCLLGYGAIARRLYDDPLTLREGNRYWKWIESYVADDYTQAVKIGSDLLEKYAAKQSPSRLEELVKIFIHATKMETGFWDMGSGGVA